MSLRDYFNSLKSPELRLAWMVAMVADATQLAALPLFVEGAFSPLDDVLDIAVAMILVRLLGWHWAFLPSLLAELVPGLDLFPTWTAAVWYVSRSFVPPEVEGTHPTRPAEPEILPPGPAPRRQL